MNWLTALSVVCLAILGPLGLVKRLAAACTHTHSRKPWRRNKKRQRKDGRLFSGRVCSQFKLTVPAVTWLSVGRLDVVISALWPALIGLEQANPEEMCLLFVQRQSGKLLDALWVRRSVEKTNKLEHKSRKKSEEENERNRGRKYRKRPRCRSERCYRSEGGVERERRRWKASHKRVMLGSMDQKNTAKVNERTSEWVFGLNEFEKNKMISKKERSRSVMHAKTTVHSLTRAYPWHTLKLRSQTKKIQISWKSRFLSKSLTKKYRCRTSGPHSEENARRKRLGRELWADVRSVGGGSVSIERRRIEVAPERVGIWTKICRKLVACKLVSWTRKSCASPTFGVVVPLRIVFRALEDPGLAFVRKIMCADESCHNLANEEVSRRKSRPHDERWVNFGLKNGFRFRCRSDAMEAKGGRTCHTSASPQPCKSFRSNRSKCLPFSNVVNVWVGGW